VSTKLIVGFMIALFMAVPLFAARTILYYENECCRNITEGEFAILYVEGLKLHEPAQGWTEQSAAAALRDLGHQPPGGWVLSRFLSEAVMAHLLKNSPFYRKPFTESTFQKSKTLVLISRARGVVSGNEGLTQGEFAVLLAEALGLQAPRGGWTGESAIASLMSQSTPIHPAQGWKPSDLLTEAVMQQILVPTTFRSAAIDPKMVVPTLQAYSLLFGKYEIATEGHFGLFVVNALGIMPPAGGWTQEKALKYIESEYGAQSGYGWSVGAPLCADTFDQALRQILVKVQKTSSLSPVKSNYFSALLKNALSARSSLSSSAFGFSAPSAGSSRQSLSTSDRKGETERVINSLRRSGMIPGDKCAIISAQALLELTPPEPPCIDCQPNPVSPLRPPQ
jgi:hypothetical protein